MNSRSEPATIFPGVRVSTEDHRYQTLVRGFNLRWVGQPRYVEVCGDTAQVVRAVQQAVDEGLRITVRGGGHCYEDFVCDNHGGVIVDLSPMNAVFRDAQSGWYGVQGGATLWDVYRQLYREYDVTIPGGSCYSVGAGGHVTGGGYGLLSRLHGLTVDYLHAVEVVHVTRERKAEAITVSRDDVDPNQQDLLWAHQGGGGGNFGIVTTFWFRDLPQAPAEAYLLSHAWDWAGLQQSHFIRLVQNYGRFLELNSGVGSPYEGLFTLLHLTQAAAQQIVLTAQYVGTAPARLEEFAGVMQEGIPAPVAQAIPVGYHHLAARTTDIQRLPWLYATQTLNGSGPNQRGKYKSAYMIKAFPDQQIETMWEHLSAAAHHNARALLQVDSYGCQVNAVAADATAIPQRSSIMKLQYQTYWTDPEQDVQNLTWIRDFYAAMYGPRGPYPDGVVDGCYVNYPDVDLADWEYLYYKDNYARLRRAKARWDPHDIFHHQQSIKPPDGTAVG
jgi:FAD/FMN-containing dehydrogenase